jgi:hypothetical protein
MSQLGWTTVNTRIPGDVALYGENGSVSLDDALELGILLVNPENANVTVFGVPYENGPDEEVALGGPFDLSATMDPRIWDPSTRQGDRASEHRGGFHAAWLGERGGESPATVATAPQCHAAKVPIFGC